MNKDREVPIIIVKKKVHGHGHHGGVCALCAKASWRLRHLTPGLDNLS